MIRGFLCLRDLDALIPFQIDRTGLDTSVSRERRGPARLGAGRIELVLCSAERGFRISYKASSGPGRLLVSSLYHGRRAYDDAYAETTRRDTSRRLYRKVFMYRFWRSC